MDQEKDLDQSKQHPEGTVCPFAHLDEASQVIRRSDLLELGKSFRDSLSPLKDLVEYMRRQVNSVTRLQRWVVALFCTSLCSVILILICWWGIRSTAKDLTSTVDRMEELEKRVNAVSTDATRAARAAEETRDSTAALASAQARTPTLEIVPQEEVRVAQREPRSRRATPVVLRLSPAPTPELQAPAAAAAPVTLQVEPATP